MRDPPRPPRWRDPESSLPIDPVGELHQEAVVRPQVEQIVQVPAEALRALDAVESVTPLTPDEEQRRPGPVLPAEHDVGAELLEVESADIVCVGRVAVH